MSINFPNLPLTVQVLVVTESEYQEIFLLSLCSRRINYLVKEARIKVPKLTFRFGESGGYNGFAIGVMSDMGSLPVTSVLHVPKLDLENILTVKLEPDQKIDTNFDIFRLKNEKFLHRMKCANEPIAIQKAFQEYIASLFHCSNRNQLILSTKYNGSLPSFTNVQEIEIQQGTVDAQFLTNVLTTYPDHQSLSVLSKIVGKIPIDSKLFQVQHVFIESRCGPYYMNNFAGRNMFLEKVFLTDQDIIMFLHKWISNEAYHNLETMGIMTNYAINGDLIRHTIEFEEYDPNEPEKRPEVLFFDIPFFGSTPMLYPLRIETVVEIKRITDGRRAFLSIDDSTLDLLVCKN